MILNRKGHGAHEEIGVRHSLDDGATNEQPFGHRLGPERRSDTDTKVSTIPSSNCSSPRLLV